MYEDESFAHFFTQNGRPVETARRLALITVLQSARGTADVVRGRIDWKCALGLELTDPSFDQGVMSLEVLVQEECNGRNG